MNPATKQIELDLLRTLPTNKNFDNIESKGVTLISYCDFCIYFLHIQLMFYIFDKYFFLCVLTLIFYNSDLLPIVREYCYISNCLFINHF